MIIPSQSTFNAWNVGQINDANLAIIETFLADMLMGVEALGPRYSLAAMALRAEHDAALSMLNRRREHFTI